MDLVCDTCGTAGNEDDGIEDGGDCAFENCDGTTWAVERLYNVVCRVVTLEWAKDEVEAVATLRRRLDDDFTVIDGEAFVSEAAPELGWGGDADEA